MTRKQYPELDETLYRETLENGLTVLVVPRKGSLGARDASVSLPSGWCRSSQLHIFCSAR